MATILEYSFLLVSKTLISNWRFSDERIGYSRLNIKRNVIINCLECIQSFVSKYIVNAFTCKFNNNFRNKLIVAFGEYSNTINIHLYIFFFENYFQTSRGNWHFKKKSFLSLFIFRKKNKIHGFIVIMSLQLNSSNGTENLYNVNGRTHWQQWTSSNNKICLMRFESILNWIRRRRCSNSSKKNTKKKFHEKIK